MLLCPFVLRLVILLWAVSNEFFMACIPGAVGMWLIVLANTEYHIEFCINCFTWSELAGPGASLLISLFRLCCLLLF